MVTRYWVITIPGTACARTDDVGEGPVMNAWLIVAAIALLALLFVVIPVAVTAHLAFRRQKLVRCPVIGLGASVLIARAGLAEALGVRSLRRVGECTYWPRRRGCAQACRNLPDEEFREFRQPPV